MAEQMDMPAWYTNLEWKADPHRAKLWDRLYRRVSRKLFPHRVEGVGTREPLTWSDHLKLRDKLRSTGVI
jgi:hypothetical protein